MFFVNFIIMIKLISLSSAAKLRCNFTVVTWNGIGDLYTCNGENTVETENNSITSIEGSHQKHKTNKGVKALQVDRRTWNYLLDGVGHFFPNIVNLQVMRCKLKRLSKKNFKGLSKIEYLNFRINDLQVIEEDTFDYCRSVTEIYINENQLTSVHRSSLSKLQNLRSLDLRYNSLTSLDPGVFRNNFKLNILLIGHNQLINIPACLFDSLPSFKNVDLTNNQCIAKVC